MKNTEKQFNPFTLTCQSFLVHDMGHAIESITSTADYLKSKLTIVSMEKHEVFSMLDEIIKKSRILYEMLNKLYRFQSDGFYTNCDFFDDILNPSLKMARELVSYQKNSFQVNLDQSVKKLPPVYVLKYQFQLLFTELIYINFIKTYKSRESIVSITGKSEKDHISIFLCIKPTYLDIHENQDIFSYDFHDRLSLKPVKETIKEHGGQIECKVAKMDDLYRSVSFHIRLPLKKETNDSIR
jgi:hypothetical protein